MGYTVIEVDDFMSRNRFSSFILFVFGLIQFVSIVRSAKGHTDQELWSAAAFFTMIGAFMSLLLIHVGNYDKFSMYVTMFILLIGMILYIATGSYWCDEYQSDVKAHMCAGVFGMSFTHLSL